MTGGGSGGHITPILAVAHELKQFSPQAEIIYIGQKNDVLADVPAADQAIDKVYSVRAGKFRRYHGEGLRQLLDIKTVLLNIRDSFWVLVGLLQSYILLRKLCPDVIFVKGGFVGVPVGLAAAKLGIPYITHDSDAIPGLANRIIARWASVHAVALPAEVYSYPVAKTVSVGIPLTNEFQPVTPELQLSYRKSINLPIDAQILFVVGGGLGAERINKAVSEIANLLLSQFPSLYIVHGVGRAHEAFMTQTYDNLLPQSTRRRVIVKGYLTDLYLYSGSSSVIVTRAGATNLAEFSMQGKACVVIPSPFLTGGHQLKNAKFLADANAAVVVDEVKVQQDSNCLAKAISELLKDPTTCAALGKKLHSMMAHTNSARQLALLLTEEANKH